MAILSLLKSLGGNKDQALTIFDRQSTRSLTWYGKWPRAPLVVSNHTCLLTLPRQILYLLSTMFKISLLFTLFLSVSGQAVRGSSDKGSPGAPGPFPIPFPGLGGCAPSSQGLFPEPEWVTIEDCAAAGPMCAFDREGTEGTWVCRTAYDFFTGASTDVSLCIGPDQALSTDTCGCCGDCPAECPCACTTRDGAKGVLVQPIRYGPAAEKEIPPKCVASPNALGMVANGYASCATECSV